MKIAYILSLLLFCTAVFAKSVPIVYTGTGCHYCEQLKADLKRAGVKFIEIKDSTKYSAVPTTEVAGKVIQGAQSDVIIKLANS